MLPSILRRAFPALIFLCCNAFAAPYPSDSDLRTAIGVAAVLVKGEGLVLKMQEARQAGVTLPLLAAGLDLRDNACQVFYNSKPDDGLKRFFESIPDKDLPVWLGAIAVHEATHCIEQREVYVRGRFDKVLPPNFRRDGMTVQGYLGVVKSGAIQTWGEALADIASVLYLRQAAPDQWLPFAQGIMTMRRELAGRWPSHDTSPWLARLLTAADDGPAQGNLFESAFELRRRFALQ